MRFKFVFSYLFFALVSFSQRVELKTIDPIMCFNDNNGELTVIDDTNWIQTYSVRGKLISRTRIIEKAVSITELKEEYTPVFMQKKLHFVERGCGRVLRFDQGKLERIDHSFSHRNQYDALVVTYRDTLYCVGGYGFFTFKDHVTYFDEGLGQWFLKNKSPEIKHRVIKPMYELYGDVLMVFGSEIDDHTNQRMKSSECLMEFSFKTGEWKKVGELTAEVARMAKNAWFYSKNTSVGSQYVLLYSPKENKVQAFSQDKTIRRFYGFKEFVVVNKLVMTSYKMYCHVIEFHVKNKYLKSKSVRFFRFRDEVSLERSYPYKLWIILVLFLIIPIFFILRRKLVLQKKGRIIPEEIHDFLALWMDSENKAIELSDLNSLVAYDNPELETLKKRREGLLKRLKQYMIEQHKFEEDEVFYTELSPRDKRIKLFILHPKVVKWYNKVK